MMKRVTNVHEILPSLQSRLVNVALPTSFKMHILLSVFLLFLPNSASFGQVFAMVCFMFANDCVYVCVFEFLIQMLDMNSTILPGAWTDVTLLNNLSYRILVKKLFLVSSELLELSF